MGQASYLTAPPRNFGERGRTRTADLSFVQYRVATARHVSRERSNRLSYPLAVFVCLLSKNSGIIAYTTRKVNGKKSPRQFVVCRGAPLWRNEPAKNKVGTSPRRSQRNQLEFAVALASEIFSGVITTSHFCVDALVSHEPASICSYFITTLQPFAV